MQKGSETYMRGRVGLDGAIHEGEVRVEKG